MTGEINYFRKRFFGGFNRKDVVDYIEKVARERGALEAERDKAVNEMRALAADVAPLRLEIERLTLLLEENRRMKENVHKTADNTFTEMELAFDELRVKIDAAANAVREELDNAGVSLEKFPETLARARERFDELRAAFNVANVAADDAAESDSGYPAADDIAESDSGYAADDAAAADDSGYVAASDSGYGTAGSFGYGTAEK